MPALLSPFRTFQGANLPRVSIITPSFNQGRFLRRTIESVLAQNYPNLEYLVIDGGSTDESLDILRSFGDRFYWVSAPDRGQAHAINKGLARAGGAILGYLNSDDVLWPGAIDRMVRHFQDHPDCDVAYGQAFIIDESDRVLGHYPTAEFDPERLRQNCFLCQPATFWRRQVMGRFGVFDERLHYALDYEYWLRLAKGGARFEPVPGVIAASREHAGTKTNQGKLESYREILAVGRRHGRQAGVSQYFGYWHHRWNDQPEGWSRWLRFMPFLPSVLGKWHYRWDECERNPLVFLRQGLKALGRRLVKVMK